MNTRIIGRGNHSWYRNEHMCMVYDHTGVLIKYVHGVWRYQGPDWISASWLDLPVSTHSVFHRILDSSQLYNNGPKSGKVYGYPVYCYIQRCPGTICTSREKTVIERRLLYPKYCHIEDCYIQRLMYSVDIIYVLTANSSRFNIH